MKERKYWSETFCKSAELLDVYKKYYEKLDGPQPVAPSSYDRKSGDTVVYVLHWSTTESYSQPPFDSAGTADSSIYEMLFDSEEEALAAYYKELAETKMTKTRDLDFSPSDHEVCTNFVTLELDVITINEEYEEESFDTVINSEYYWLND